MRENKADLARDGRVKEQQGQHVKLLLVGKAEYVIGFTSTSVRPGLYTSFIPDFKLKTYPAFVAPPALVIPFDRDPELNGTKNYILGLLKATMTTAHASY